MTTLFRYAVVANPTQEVTSTDALYKANGGYVEKDLFDYFNPVAIIEQNTAKSKTQRLLGNVRADLEITEGLVASISVAQERGTVAQNEFYSKESKYSRSKTNGYAVREDNNLINNLMEITGYLFKANW